jgi:hypothetical protein
MSNIKVFYPTEKVGDFLGALPAIERLGEFHDVKLFVNPDIYKFLDKITLPTVTHSVYYPYPYVSHEVRGLQGPSAAEEYVISTNAAYDVGFDSNLHMTQAYFDQLKMKIPLDPIRPRLLLPTLAADVPVYDYVIAPYSVSLAWGHLWPMEKWNKLIKRFSKYKFALVGSTTDPRFPEHPNLQQYLGHPWFEIAHIIERARMVLSVVSGISHLTYALGTPHVLFINQPKWAQNPNAKAQLTDYLITEIPFRTVVRTLELIRKGETPGNLGTGNYIKGRNLDTVW